MNADAPQSKAARAPRAAVELPRISRAWLRFFTRYTRRFMSRHFDAVMLSRAGAAPTAEAGSVVVYLNHPSWWDPIACLHVGRRAFPGRPLYAPMDAAELARYGIFKKIGMFGVRPGAAGARDFLRNSEHVLAQPGATLWITAQGHFVDARVRPVRLAAGVAELARRNPEARFVPLALEYPPWNERLPVALACFGTAERGRDLVANCGNGRGELTVHLERRLAETMDALAAEAQARDATAFEMLLSGRRGTSRIYDLWRQFTAWVRGETYTPGHTRS